MHRISGLSLFKTGDFSSARGHLEEFVNSTESPNDDAVYALAATEYADGDYSQAKTRFRTLTDLNNMLAQGAYLYLGQIAERDGDLNEAAMAFNKAANMAFDPNVAETALFNYIVASSKGAASPSRAASACTRISSEDIPPPPMLRLWRKVSPPHSSVRTTTPRLSRPSTA